MGFDVKNTTKVGLLDLFCPYTCRGCGALGSVVCECCKKHMLAQRRNICPICKRKVERTEQKCRDCDLPFQRLYVGGYREGSLAKAISEYKYQSVRALGRFLGELLLETMPEDLGVEAEKVIVVPLPTIGKHVRQRGLDHTKNLAKRLAKARGWNWEKILTRATDTVQVGKAAEERKEQAAKTYQIAGRVEADKTYVLLDDVWTTGASMLAAAKMMRKAGAENLIGVVLATGKANEIDSDLESESGKA